MQQNRIITTSILFFPLFIGFMLHQQSKNEQPALHKPVTITVTGTVVDASSNKPVNNTHVYIIHGEEEDLTNDKGEFKIETSQQLPLTLSAEHTGYEKFRVALSSNNGKQVIKLKPKAGGR